MNRDDRSALIDMGKQFAPNLFAELDAGEVKDELLLEQVGKAFAVLHAAARSNDESPSKPLSSGAQHLVADDQPSYAEVGLWLEKQNLSVTRREMHFQEQPGGRRRRVYRAVPHPATVDDVLGSKLDAGEMHLVMSDGKTHCLPWK